MTDKRRTLATNMLSLNDCRMPLSMSIRFDVQHQQFRR